MNLIPLGCLCEERSDEFLGRGSGSASVAIKMSFRLVTGVFRVAKHDCEPTLFHSPGFTSSKNHDGW